MRWYKEAVLLLAVVFLLASYPVSSIEYKPGEKVAEDLFNHGIGKPWVGGDSPKSTSWTWPKHSNAVTPYSSYEFIGYLNVAGSMSIISDSGDSVQLLAGPGTYPLFGYYLGGRLVGVVIDFSDSRRPVQIYPY
jgi:hypothetical protein